MSIVNFSISYVVPSSPATKELVIYSHSVQHLTAIWFSKYHTGLYRAPKYEYRK